MGIVKRIIIYSLCAICISFGIIWAIKTGIQDKILPQIDKIDAQIFTPEPLIASIKDDHASELSVEKILYWTNYYRKENNLEELTINNTLLKASLDKANDMLKRQYFAHIDPDGKGVADAVEVLGYNYKMIGENLAMGDFADEKDLVDAWMASPGHRENILNPSYTEIGISAVLGIFEDNTVWMSVQTFGTPSPICTLPDASLKYNITNQEQIYDKINQLISEGNTLINQGNAKIRYGNEIYEETKDASLAQIYWDEGENLQDMGNNKISEADALKGQVADLKFLIEQYNEQVNIYNNCINK